MTSTRRRGIALAGGAGAIACAVAAATLAGSGAAAAKQRPEPVREPTITGTAKEGETLFGHNGTWKNHVNKFAFFWMRCDRSGGSCSNIAGANAFRYKLVNADVGRTIRFKVQATNGDGQAISTSNPSDPVRAAGASPPPPSSPPPSPPPSNGCPSGSGPADIADISSPAHLILDGQQADPATVTANTQDITIRYHVSSSCGGDVRGALVYTTAVPFNQWSIPAETPTGSDGWASMTMHRLSGFPVGPHQQLIALFARARKSGESLLGGISARRLFSLRVNLRG
jgi:hypothetical protein